MGIRVLAAVAGFVLFAGACGESAVDPASTAADTVSTSIAPSTTEASTSTVPEVVCDASELDLEEIFENAGADPEQKLSPQDLTYLLVEPFTPPTECGEAGIWSYWMRFYDLATQAVWYLPTNTEYCSWLFAQSPLEVITEMKWHLSGDVPEGSLASIGQEAFVVAMRSWGVPMNETNVEYAAAVAADVGNRWCSILLE